MLSTTVPYRTMSMKQSYPLAIFAQETSLYMVQKTAVDLVLVTRSWYVRYIDLTCFFFRRVVDEAEAVFHRKRGQYSQIRTKEANILNKDCFIMALLATSINKYSSILGKEWQIKLGTSDVFLEYSGNQSECLFYSHVVTVAGQVVYIPVFFQHEATSISVLLPMGC